MAPRAPTDSNQAKALALVARYQDHGDIAARNDVIAAHMPLVTRAIQKYPGARKCPGDAQNVGVLALIHACDKFDRTKSNSFGAYAALWVRAYLLQFLRSQRTLIDHSRAGRTMWNGYGKAVAKLSKGGRTVTNEEVAAELGITPAALVHALGSLQHPVSFDGPVAGASEDDGRELHDRLPCPRPRQDALLEAAQGQHVATAAVYRALATLTPREREIIEARYLRDADEPRPALRAMGASYGLTGERIRQIERQAMGKLRSLLSDRRSA